jgi:hypothetical protein
MMRLFPSDLVAETHWHTMDDGCFGFASFRQRSGRDGGHAAGAHFQSRIGIEFPIHRQS